MKRAQRRAAKKADRQRTRRNRQNQRTERKNLKTERVAIRAGNKADRRATGNGAVDVLTASAPIVGDVVEGVVTAVGSVTGVSSLGGALGGAPPASPPGAPVRQQAPQGPSPMVLGAGALAVLMVVGFAFSRR